MRCWHPRAEKVVQNVKSLIRMRLFFYHYIHNIQLLHQDHPIKNGKMCVKKIIIKLKHQQFVVTQPMKNFC